MSAPAPSLAYQIAWYEIVSKFRVDGATFRSGEQVFAVSALKDGILASLRRLETLEAENARLREALKIIAAIHVPPTFAMTTDNLKAALRAASTALAARGEKA